jgi:6-phosphofructokinase 1
MVTLQRRAQADYACETAAAPLSEIANAEKLLPDAYITEQGNDIAPAFLEYARPLIGDPLSPLGRLARHHVPGKEE